MAQGEEIKTAISLQEDDDCEAPKSVSFIQSKSEALLAIMTEKQQKRLIQENRKKKRKNQEAKLLQQKEERNKRLSQLASVRLSEDLVDNITDDVTSGVSKKCKDNAIKANWEGESLNVNCTGELIMDKNREERHQLKRKFLPESKCK